MHDEWNGYKAGETVAYRGTLYLIVRIEVHHESGWAGAVLRTGYDKQLYVIDIPYHKKEWTQ